MADAEKVSLDKLRQALQQPNNAIRKRALAIIFNEARIEALPLIEEYLGWETEPDLQGLALKVRRKLQDFQATCSQVPTEKLLALLQHSTTESRILALRGLVEHRSARLAELVCQVCGQETSPEVLTLVAKILRRNPSPGNIPVLLRLIEHPAEEIRQDALEGILSIIFGCLYPLVLKTLLDPSPQLKMRAYQLISNISRPNLLEALDFMFSCGDQAMSRLAGTLLPSFLGPDLLPILDRHLAHADADTAALCKRAVILLAQKGNSEAARLVARIQSENPAKAGAAGPGARPPGPFQEFLATYPRFLTEPLLVDFPLDDPSKILERLREVNARITDLLVFPFILSYFAVANRNPFLDRACFKVLRFGLAKTNPVNFLRTVAPAFPPPAGKDDLFPVVLADRLQNDFNDQTLERYAQLQNGADGHRRPPDRSAPPRQPGHERPGRPAARPVLRDRQPPRRQAHRHQRPARRRFHASHPRPDRPQAAAEFRAGYEHSDAHQPRPHPRHLPGPLFRLRPLPAGHHPHHAQ
ncbi:MAG: hypothetical protein OZSIB_1370 [Candidatus Ozemobacter sibiricus]|uniref:HEAT repeat domain-containing protein n=1 Tax=Candidatus Ozemobacter sibiricus TaxID=2268124 RepID=A0A367ZK85_9BACT|nr:MAG: hypothetical protein OZSIB_1370 [Candidatus Ozemobacter sibiricus]